MSPIKKMLILHSIKKNCMLSQINFIGIIFVQLAALLPKAVMSWCTQRLTKQDELARRFTGKPNIPSIENQYLLTGHIYLVS